MTTEHIGPSLWHGREVNSCTRCKYLRCQLVKSGRDPDYEYYCMHPSVLAGEHKFGSSSAILQRIAEKYPQKLEYFKVRFAEDKAEIARDGEFISNDSYTPETPYWCPVITQKEK